MFSIIHQNLLSTIILAIAYWFLPSKNQWILLLLMYLSYGIFSRSEQNNFKYVKYLYWWIPVIANNLSISKNTIFAINIFVIIAVILVLPYL